MRLHGLANNVIATVSITVALSCGNVSETKTSHEDLLSQHPPTAMWFSDITREAGVNFVHQSGSAAQLYILESMGGGTALFDADSDSYLDLFMVNGSQVDPPDPPPTHRFYRNTLGDKTRGPSDPFMVDQTVRVGLDHSGWGMGCTVGDIDNDGHADLYLTYWGPNALYQNHGDGTFYIQTDVAAHPDWSSSAAFGDLDSDGDLDLYVANYLAFDLEQPPNDGAPCKGWKGLETFCGPHGMNPQADVLYRNDGDGTFVDVSNATGIDRYYHPGLGVIFADLDNDGDQDLYVANDSEPNLLFRNDSKWNVTEVAAFVGAAYSEEGRAQAGMGVDAADYDGDGDLDLFVTHFSDDVNTLYENQGDGTFQDATARAGLAGLARPFLGWSTFFFDPDNDGWLDLFVANGHLYPQLNAHPEGLRYAQRNLLYWNEGGRYEAAPLHSLGASMAAHQVSRGAAMGDWDNDGDSDIVVANLNDAPMLLRNDGGNNNAWLGLELQGEASNRDGIGARVTVRVDEHSWMQEVKRSYGYQSQHDPRLLFGLGSADHVDKVEIRWPSGQIQFLENPPLRRYLVLTEGVADIASSYASAADFRTPSDIIPPTSRLPGPEHRYTVTLPDTANLSSSDLYRLGVQRYRQGRYREAHYAFKAVINQNPGHLRAHYSLGTTLYSGLGLAHKALTVLKKAVILDSSVAKVHELIGAIHLSLDQARLAEAALDQASKLDSTSWSAPNRLALARLRLHNDVGAEEAFLQAIERAHYEPQPHLRLARLYRRQGKEQAALRQEHFFSELRPLAERVDAYERELREHPRDVHTHYVLGQAYYAQGRLERAEESFDKALDLDADFGPAYYGRGSIMRQRGHLEEALVSYQQAVRLQPDLSGAFADMGQIFHAARRFEEAITAYKHALGLQPNLHPIRTRLGLALLSSGRLEEATAELQAVIIADSTQIEAGIALTRIRDPRGPTGYKGLGLEPDVESGLIPEPSSIQK